MEGYAQVIGSLMILFVIVIISRRSFKRKPVPDSQAPQNKATEQPPSDSDQNTT